MLPRAHSGRSRRAFDPSLSRQQHRPSTLGIISTPLNPYFFTLGFVLVDFEKSVVLEEGGTWSNANGDGRTTQKYPRMFLPFHVFPEARLALLGLQSNVPHRGPDLVLPAVQLEPKIKSAK